MSLENVYRENGYSNRNEYLSCLSDEYNIPMNELYPLASILGEEEDFDGLVIQLEDMLSSDYILLD